MIGIDGQPFLIINKSGIDTKTLAHASDAALPAALAFGAPIAAPLITTLSPAVGTATNRIFGPVVNLATTTTTTTKNRRR